MFLSSSGKPISGKSTMSNLHQLGSTPVFLKTLSFIFICTDFFCFSVLPFFLGGGGGRGGFSSDVILGQLLYGYHFSFTTELLNLKGVGDWLKTATS